MPELEVGQMAPDFTGETHAHGTMKLSQLRGKSVILYWYPKDDTSGCTIEACNFRDDYAELRAAGAEVVGVSCDDLPSHEAFSGKFDLPFPLVADADGKITALYGVPRYASGNELWPKRWTFLIGPDGRILRKWERVDVKTHSKEILDIVAGRAAKS